MIALQGIGQALLAIEARLARLESQLATGTALADDEPFEWESIEDYREITGIVPVDKALACNAPEVLLPEYLARRERRDGRDGVIDDSRRSLSDPRGQPSAQQMRGVVGAPPRRRGDPRALPA